ncbi:MAG: acetate--CoA ligase family protein [Nitrospira sp.]|nr:acetate--CoA ligase family protein [Nitrospira sp.]
MKLASHTLVHKTEIGGVHLNLTSKRVRCAMRMRRSPHACLKSSRRTRWKACSSADGERRRRDDGGDGSRSLLRPLDQPGSAGSMSKFWEMCVSGSPR